MTSISSPSRDATASCASVPGLGSPVVAIALRVPFDPDDPATAAAALAAIDVDDEVGAPGTGPVAFGALPFDRSAPHVAARPRDRRRARRRRHALGDDDRRCRSRRGPRPRRRRAARATVARSRVDPAATPACVVRPRRAARRSDMTGGPLAQGGARPRGRRRPPTRRSTSSPSLRRLRAAYPGCHLFSVDGFVGASPELLVSAPGDVVRSHPMAGTAPRRRRPGSRRPRSRRRSSRRPRTARSTRSPSTWCTTRCCRGARTSTTRPSRRSSPWPTCSTSPRSSRAGCRSRRRRCSSSSPRCTRRRRCAAGPATRRWRSSPSTRSSTGAATPAPSAGSTPRQRLFAVRIRCAEIDGRHGPASSPATASSPTPIPQTELAETQAKSPSAARRHRARPLASSSGSRRPRRPRRGCARGAATLAAPIGARRRRARATPPARRASARTAVPSVRHRRSSA